MANSNSHDDDQPRVEEILDSIRERVREEFHEDHSTNSLQDDLRYLLDNCRLSQERTIVSNRRWFGWLYVWARKIIYSEIRRSVDELFAKQTAWNRKAASVMQRQQDEIDRLRCAVGAANAQAAEDDEPQYGGRGGGGGMAGRESVVRN